ncbi:MULTISPECIES: hypothetical protein [unclassified Aeromonas]|uniref:hypothetical protein n=1 Tax=unclassified Aeromonas TaxID=257493 RepID=UPI0022E1C6D5|nr:MULTISPECIES: hypothetical protein [unclassified Aeromonas]
MEAAVASKKNCYGDLFTVSSPIFLGVATDIDIRIKKLIWDGVSDIGNADRSIGVINIYGEAGLETAISGQQTEGTSTFTVADPSLFAAGDYVQIKGGKTDYVCAITNISGSAITIDYALGWDNTGETLSLRQVTKPAKNVRVTVGEFVDISQTTNPEAMVSGVSLIMAVHCSVIVGEAIDTTYPVIFTSNTYLCAAKNSHLKKPRDTSAGRGYLVQWNKAHKAYNHRLTGCAGRHLIDYTRAAHCKAFGCESSQFDNYPYSAHGAYEHDLTFTDCSNPVGKYAIALAQSGPTFGQQTKRVTFSGGVWDGDMLCDIFPTDVTFHNMELLGKNSILINPTYRLGGNGHFTMLNVKMKNPLSSTVFRGTGAPGYPLTANVFIDSGSITGRYVEFIGINGDVIVGDSIIGQPFSTGGLAIDRFIMNGGAMNQHGGTTLNCRKFSMQGVSTFGRADNVRLTVNCEMFTKVGGEDLQSPSFGVSGASKLALSGFNSFAGRTGITVNSYQLLGGANCDISLIGVGLLHRNPTAANAFDIDSVSSNRVKLRMVGCDIGGAVNLSNTTVLTHAIITNNQLKSGVSTLPPADATHLLNSNLFI